MQRARLSKNFWLDEFCRSDIAARLGREVEVEVGSAIHLNLQRLCRSVLQPLRDALGCPVLVTSGYRPGWLNDYVRGSDTSDHLVGLAADIVAGTGHPPFVVAQAAMDLDLPVDQVIHEYGRWVHVSAPAEGCSPAKDVLTAVHDGVRTVYLPGVLTMAEAKRRLG
mgnify:CR=1 FL=1